MQLRTCFAAFALLSLITLPARADEPAPKTARGKNAAIMIVAGAATFTVAYGARMWLYGDGVEGALWATPAVGGVVTGSALLGFSIVPHYGGGAVALHGLAILGLGTLEGMGIGAVVAGLIEACKPAAPVRPYVTGQSVGVSGTW